MKNIKNERNYRGVGSNKKSGGGGGGGITKGR